MYQPARIEALDRRRPSNLQLYFGRGLENLGAAYQAGYMAPMAALTTKDGSGVADHPTANAATQAARSLQLAEEYRALAAQGATGYYSAAQVLQPLAEQIAWAHRVRAAGRWAP